MLLQQFINGITIGSTYALVAIGFTMIFGVLELTNFSNSSLYMFGAYVTWLLYGVGINFFVAFALSIALTGLLGFSIDRFALRLLRKRHAPKLLLGHDADHFLFRQGKQNPDGVCHAGVVGAENAAARRDLLPARHMKDRVPEKQPDAAQPPAQMVPEVHPSFLLTISKMALTDCSTVSPEVSSSTASAACFNGAMARSESCLSRCFVSARICA